MQITDIIKLSLRRLISYCFCRCSSTSKSELDETLQERKMRLYKQGEDKIMKELDCVNIMMKLRQLELLVSLFLNQKQKFLLNF